MKIIAVLMLPFLAVGFVLEASVTETPTPAPKADVETGKLVAHYADLAGFRGYDLVIATAIAGPESGWRSDAEGDRHLINGCECHSHGWFQIRSCPRGDPAVTYDTGGCRLDRGTRAELIQPDFNARVAFDLYRSSRSWGHWAAYRSGAYRAWLPLAEQAVDGLLGGR